MRTTALAILPCSLWLLALWPGPGGAEEAAQVDAFGRVWPWRPLSGNPTPALSRSENGASGSCLSFDLPESSSAQFVGRVIDADASWSRAEGLSFWFKGDGGTSFVSITLLDESLTRRYAALLSLQSRHWRKVCIRWEDFVPEVITADWMGMPEGNMKPENVRGIWFGRWYYLRPWEASVFAVDEMRLEEKVDLLPPTLPARAGMPRTLQKLRAKQPVTIVALGDSVTYGTNLNDRAAEAYPAVLQDLLRKRFGYSQIRVFNRGVGGIETRQGILLIARDVAVEPPDLVTTHFGYNDYASMMGKPMSEAKREEIVRWDLRALVTRIYAATQGRTEVLLIGTTPGADDARREALDLFGEAARRIAEEMKCGYAEGPKTAFKKAWESGGIRKLFGVMPHGQPDPAHPNGAGHRVFAEALMEAFAGEESLRP